MVMCNEIKALKLSPRQTFRGSLLSIRNRASEPQDRVEEGQGLLLRDRAAETKDGNKAQCGEEDSFEQLPIDEDLFECIMSATKGTTTTSTLSRLRRWRSRVAVAAEPLRGSPASPADHRPIGAARRAAAAASPVAPAAPCEMCVAVSLI